MLALGLMSGTSLDGIDAALIETDGMAAVRPVASATRPYTADERAVLADAVRAALALDRPARGPAIARADRLLVDTHAALARELLARAGVAAAAVGVCGFHGQTVAHRPDRGWTWQVGDGAALADALGVPVVDGMRVADVAAGGQGAPLLPAYHAARCAGLSKPVAVLNLGGVGNVTWIGGDGIGEDGIGADGIGDGGALVAFDTGPANGLVDGWVQRHTGHPYDRDGALAAAGEVHPSVLDTMLDHPWFDAPPPKSLDRHDFTDQPAAGLSAADGAATLTRFTADTVALALRLCPAPPRRLVVAGGGRHNPTLMRMIGEACGLRPEPVEALGWDGDATEAEGFAYLAVRSLAGLPLSFPGTTGVPRPLTGGVLHRPRG